MDGIKSCGVIVFKEEPTRSFLLMRHHDRWDLPKGHVDPGETEIECAMRELVEETGISNEQILLDPDFKFTLNYVVRPKRLNYVPHDKTLVLFLGFLNEEVSILPTEHIGYEWKTWAPPHSIQPRTIDPALQAVDEHWRVS